MVRQLFVVVCVGLLGGCASESDEWTSFPADAPDDAYAARAHINGEGRVFIDDANGWYIRESASELNISREGAHSSWLLIRMSGTAVASMFFDGDVHAGGDSCRVTVNHSIYEIDCPPMATGWVQTGLVRELR